MCEHATSPSIVADMPFVHIAWIPKACRNQAVREEVAAAVRKAMVGVKSADISPDNLVVRFSESVDVSRVRH